MEQTPHGVLITVDIEGLPPGPHALHIHEVGKCEPPFQSAGGHFNPIGKSTGFSTPRACTPVTSRISTSPRAAS
ncbi:MAG: superoxide dismutase family protein [Candidatus Binatia bacterium]